MTFKALSPHQTSLVTNPDSLAAYLAQLCGDPARALPMIRHRIRRGKLHLKHVQNQVAHWSGTISRGVVPEEMKAQTAEELVAWLEEKSARAAKNDAKNAALWKRVNDATAADRRDAGRNGRTNIRSMPPDKADSLLDPAGRVRRR